MNFATTHFEDGRQITAWSEINSKPDKLVFVTAFLKYVVESLSILTAVESNLLRQDNTMNLREHPQSESESRDAAEPGTVPEPQPPVELPVEYQTPADEPPVAESMIIVEPPDTEPVRAEPSSPPGLLYTAKQGETLWGIAKKFGTTIDAIVEANTLQDRNTLRAGQKLIIPR